MYVSFTKSARAANRFPFSNFAFEFRERLSVFYKFWNDTPSLRASEDNVSVPFKTVWTFSAWNGLLFLKLYWSSLIGKIDLTKDGERSLYVLYFSVASFCKFRWWILKELSLRKSSSKDKLWSLYTMRRPLSCNLFIRLFKVRLWNIHTYKWAVAKLRFNKRFHKQS